MTSKKKIRARAARLGISYETARNMYRPKPEPKPQLLQQFQLVQTLASDLDFTVEDHEESGLFLMGHDIAITFSRDENGMDQALAWLAEYQEANFLL